MLRPLTGIMTQPLPNSTGPSSLNGMPWSPMNPGMHGGVPRTATSSHEASQPTYRQLRSVGSMQWGSSLSKDPADSGYRTVPVQSMPPLAYMSPPRMAYLHGPPHAPQSTSMPRLQPESSSLPPTSESFVGAPSASAAPRLNASTSAVSTQAASWSSSSTLPPTMAPSPFAFRESMQSNMLPQPTHPARGIIPSSSLQSWAHSAPNARTPSGTLVLMQTPGGPIPVLVPYSHLPM